MKKFFLPAFFLTLHSCACLHASDLDNEDKYMLEAKKNFQVQHLAHMDAFPEILSIIKPAILDVTVTAFFQETLDTMYTRFPHPKHSQAILLEMYQCLYGALLTISNNSDYSHEQKSLQQFNAIKERLAFPGHMKFFKVYNTKIYNVLLGSQGCMECLKKQLEK